MNSTRNSSEEMLTSRTAGTGQGHYRADGDLHERQRQPRHNLAQHRRADHTGQHNERQFQNFHVRLFSSRNFPLTVLLCRRRDFRGANVPHPFHPCHAPVTSRAAEKHPGHRRPIAPFIRVLPRSAEHAGNSQGGIFAIGRNSRAQKGRSYSPYLQNLHTTTPKHSPYRKILHT